MTQWQTDKGIEGNTVSRYGDKFGICGGKGLRQVTDCHAAIARETIKGERADFFLSLYREQYVSQIAGEFAIQTPTIGIEDISSYVHKVKM